MSAISDLLGVKLSDIPQPQQSTIVAALTEIVLSRLTEELYGQLNEQDKKALEDLTDSEGSQEKVLEFLKSRFPDFEDRARRIAAEEQRDLESKVKTMVDVINKNKTP